MLRSKLLNLYTRTYYSTNFKQVLKSGQIRNLSAGQKGFIHLSEEVRDALHYGKGVVALESAIITHGMPYPQNLSTALEVENVVRNNGAIPATTAVVNGQVHVGLSKEEIEYLANPKTSCTKTSRRDFPFVLSAGLNGGTTVSGTMVAAHLAGIPVFVTGGIGGVHRGAEDSMDISADLTELGRTPITVVSAGIKSILDIGRTLEYLETEGVCVSTFGPDKNFPAFFAPKSGFLSPYNVTTPADAAAMIATHLQFGLSSGILIGVPIPEEYSAQGEQIEMAIQSAVTEAVEREITGKEVTPLILQRVNELTEGASLKANIALVKNNAAVGSQIAVELSKLRKHEIAHTDRSNQSHRNISQNYSGSIGSDAPFKAKVAKTNTSSSSESGRVVVIGGSIVDFYARVEVSDFQNNGATYPGSVQQSFGGVGRNIADGLSRLGMDPLFISAIGEDSHQTAYEAYCQHMNLSGVRRLDNQRTATYCAVLKQSGGLMFGIGDMDIHNQISPSYISQFEEDISKASVVCLDGNISSESMTYVMDLCHNNKVPVWFDPTDIHKAVKPFASKVHGSLTYSSPNLNELRQMYLGLTGAFNLRVGHAEADELSLEAVLEEAIWLSKVVVQEIPVVIVTVGKHGVVLCRKTEGDKFPTTHQTVEVSDHMSVDHFPAISEDIAKIVSVSGAGDCLTAAILAGTVKGYDLDLCVKAGLSAARLSLQSYHAVPSTITPDLMNLTEINKWAPWQPKKLKSH